MKILLISLAVISLISCSHSQKSNDVASTPEASKESEKFQIPNYTGKWTADGGQGIKWSLHIIEMAFQKPQPNNNGGEDFLFAQVAAILKVKFPPNKNQDFPNEFIYSLSGERVLGNRFLLGTAMYEGSYPTHTWLLKFDIPIDLSNGFTAWFEHARTGGFPASYQKHNEVKNEIFKLKFKRE
jgi:hypothetical protein